MLPPGRHTVKHQFMSDTVREACPVHLQEQTAGGSSPEQKEARERRALERRAQAELDMERDAEEQPETRWPYISRRGRVRLCRQPPHLCWLPSHSTACCCQPAQDVELF